MSKIKRGDIIAIVIFIAVWTFYIFFEGQTRFDVNQILTLPLLIAVDYTAFVLLYAIWRYNVITRGKLDLAQMITQAGGGGESPGEDNTVDKESSEDKNDSK